MISTGVVTCAMFIASCWSATALASSLRGISSPTQACRAGPITENATPINSVAPSSRGIEIAPLTISAPTPPMIRPGAICPANTSGFFG